MGQVDYLIICLHVKPAGSGNKKITDLPGFSKAKASIPSSVMSETANVIVKMCATDIRYGFLFWIMEYGLWRNIVSRFLNTSVRC